MMRIFLIGFMGSGKTTIGKILAERLGWSFVDMDAFIEKKYFKTITQLFEEKGEHGFREIEHQVLVDLSEFEHTIISTGGGAPCFYNNVEIMTTKGTCVYLQLSVKELLARLQSGKAERPLISNKNAEELYTYIEQTLSIREPFYRKASFVIDCNKKSIADVAALILTNIETKNSSVIH